MKNKIKFVREYANSNGKRYDIVYCSWRVRSIYDGKLPSTVKQFILDATKVTKQTDELYGEEIIYEA